jgi:uncharacterized protein (DUF2141 family)
MTLVILLLSMACLCQSPSPLPSGTLSLEVKAHGFRGEGNAHVLLYAQGQKLKLNCRDCPHQTLSIKQGACRFRFEGLAPGSYAVLVYHDENNNGKLDTNALGMPKEGVGTSNKHQGIPSYKKCAFSLVESTSISIEMVYL